MPDARGDVLCPTCGRWTPPAPFCNECGAALQAGFRDPVGGQGSDVFRRGHEVDKPGAPWSSRAERFEPEPEDQAVRAASAAGAAGVTPVDYLAESDAAAPEAAAPEPGWPAEPGLPAEDKPPADEPATDETEKAETPPAAMAAAAAPATAGMAAPAAASATPRGRSRASAPPPVDEPAPPPPVAPPPPPSPPRSAAAPDSNGGVSGLVFVAFLGLGILALLGGAILGGVFDEGPAAEASPSATPIVGTASPEPTPEASSAGPSPTSAPTSPVSSAEPTTFPDGFLARAETCDEEPTGPTCNNSGATNDGELWVLVSFRHAKPTDVIGVSIIDGAGDVAGESSLELSFCGANTDCAGYTYFGFNNLDPGSYRVRVTRNGTLAATTTFTVE